uniref:glycosyltransferase n=1 Tax=Prevotella sp. TaxID=59823 RepID=UPI0040261E88
MPTLFQINVTCNWGSTGRIAEEIGQVAIQQGWDSYIAYGRGKPVSKSHLIRIGNDCDMYEHGLETRIFDNHGLASRGVTQKLIRQIEEIKPDVIQLHNVHGYFVNYPILFGYLAKCKIPVVWTLHDCWTFTGHCAHFALAGCYQWKNEECSHCKYKKSYPASLFFNRAHRNFLDKKKAFTAPKNMTIVTVSHWLEELVQQSFLSCHQVITINNGIDVQIFSPKNNGKKIREKLGISQPYMLLGVASVWEASKGIFDFVKLRELLPADQYAIVLVGVDDRTAKILPQGIVTVKRTNNVEELAEIYSVADVFLNPTWQDSFPTTNLEAMACGTPVVTYRTGGSPESLTEKTGKVVEQGDLVAFVSNIEEICKKGKNTYVEVCRQGVVENYNKKDRYLDYIKLYQQLLISRKC